MSRKHRKDRARPPLPPLSPAQIMERDARRLCHVMASGSGAPAWLSIEDLTACARSGADATKRATAFAVNRGWMQLAPSGRVMVTRLGLGIAGDQRLWAKHRRPLRSAA